MTHLLDVTVRAIYRIWRDRRRANTLRDIAQAYNRTHTYAGHNRVDGHWMCPTCNQTHACIGWSPFTGRQFPACCGIFSGHRCDKAHATGIK